MRRNLKKNSKRKLERRYRKCIKNFSSRSWETIRFTILMEISW